MFQIILLIIIIFIAYIIFRKIAALFLKLIGATLIAVLGIAIGPPVLVAYIVERTCKALKMRAAVSVLLITAGCLAALAWGGFDLHPSIDIFSFWALKFILSAFLFISMLYFHKAEKEIIARSVPLDLFQKKSDEFYLCFFSAFTLLSVSIYTKPLLLFIGWFPLSTESYIEFSYWMIAAFIQVYIVIQESQIKFLSKEIFDKLRKNKILFVDGYISELEKKYNSLDKKDIETIFQGISAKFINAGILQELEFSKSSCIFNKIFYEIKVNQLQMALAEILQNTEKDVIDCIERNFSFPKNYCEEYNDRYLDFGDYHHFKEGKFFISYVNSSKINVCISCGLTELTNEIDIGVWYCSSTCKETEAICLTIKDKPQEEFVSEAATSGFLLINGGQAWNQNHKLFSIGGQGHGFAAEKTNHKIDRLMGKDAKIVGDNNAKNGADRIVNIEKIQTKYYHTGKRSIGAGFDGQNGLYKYFDENGNPMQIEVPRDQYSDAVQEMRKRILRKQIPGVTDPGDAKKLVRKGHITYSQAVNVTKFGTLESISYDVSEGVIVGTSAGGISFGITATIYYLNTKDSKEALKVAAIQAGKTFSRSLVVYVSSQQLHRVAAIQSALKSVSLHKLSPTLRKTIQNGLGAKSASAAEKALRGTIVTSIAIVAVSTGPDLVKMVRGHISGAQFIKNLSVVSSGVGGGAVGAIAGGAVGAVFGPVGVFVGQAAGAMIVGTAASWMTNKLAKKFMQEDQEIVMEIIKIQIEYLAVIFMLSTEEIDNLNNNLEKVIIQETLELIFAAKNNRRSMANFFLKPIVVSVIKQRPSLSYEANDVIEACGEWVN